MTDQVCQVLVTVDQVHEYAQESEKVIQVLQEQLRQYKQKFGELDQNPTYLSRAWDSARKVDIIYNQFKPKFYLV